MTESFTPLLTTTDWNAEWMQLQKARRHRDSAVYWNERAAAFRPDHPACRQNRAFFAGEMDSSQENASKREDSGK